MENLVESQQAKPKGLEAKKKPESRDLTMSQTETGPRVVQTKGARFTLSAQDVEVKTILLALGKEIKQNITIEPSITHRATVDLKNVTLNEALDNILNPLRLKYEINKEFIRVYSEQMQTRIFKLNYITSRRIGSSSVSASSGASGGSSGSGGGGASGGASSGVGGGASIGGGSSAGQSTSSSIVTSESSDLWTEIRSGLQQIIMGTSGGATASAQTLIPCGGGGIGGGATPTAPTSPVNLSSLTGGASGSSGADQTSTPQQPADRRFVSLNCQAGIIIVRDYPDALLKVAEFLEAIEGSVQRQVFIQAKILEVSLNKNFSLGIDWSKVTPLTIIRNNPVPGSGAPGTTSTTTSSVPLTTTPGQVGVFGAMLQGSAGLFGLSTSNSNLNIVIDALSQQGNVSVLSSPKIATMNNQRAVIKVGTQDVYFVPETSSVQGATTTNYIPRSITIGIVLDVLPQIDANGMVMMSINTSISEKAGDRISADGRISVPILDVRESNNVVLSRNGQTIVIGGLMKNKITKKRDSVPLLGDIPLIGKAFQHDADVDEKTELVIMLTPEIMAGLSVDDHAVEAQSSIKQFGYPRESR
jgi:MSHA type pilus biogenesis protein MshL